MHLLTMTASILLLNTLLNSAYITAIYKPKSLKNLENEEQGLPECLSHKILLYVFGLEHRETMQRLDILSRIEISYYYKKFDSRMHSGSLDHDLKHFCDHYFKCNCCPSHQCRKVNITYNDDNKECLHIVIKPEVFYPIYQHEWDRGLPQENTRCPGECWCRHRTRFLARRWISKHYVKPVVPDTSLPSKEAERAYHLVGRPSDREKFMSVFKAGLIVLINCEH
jgi:hypothetical protein